MSCINVYVISWILNLLILKGISVGPPCFVMVVGSFQLKNAFSETGYPEFYQWEQSLKEMKWFCPPITILT